MNPFKLFWMNKLLWKIEKSAVVKEQRNQLFLSVTNQLLSRNQLLWDDRGLSCVEDRGILDFVDV